jgi:endo-1,4-beta-D-glucanase Y
MFQRAAVINWSYLLPTMFALISLWFSFETVVDNVKLDETMSFQILVA